MCRKCVAKAEQTCRFLRKVAMPNFGACCAHDHDCEAADCGPSWSLHEHVDMSHVSPLISRAASDHSILHYPAVLLSLSYLPVFRLKERLTHPLE